MFDEGKLNFFESCNIEILNNAINLFVNIQLTATHPPIHPFTLTYSSHLHLTSPHLTSQVNFDF